MKNVLVIFANPNKKSFGTSLGKSFIKGLKKNSKENNVKELYLSDLKFDLNEKKQFQEQILEDDILKAQELILWANHIVFCYPIWWYNFPAVLKGFFDRTFQSGFAFKFDDKPFPVKLLKGRTAQAIVTMDAPPIFYRLVIGINDKRILRQMLNFCGVKMLSHNYFGSIKKSDEKKKIKWLDKAYKLGLNYR